MMANEVNEVNDGDTHVDLKAYSKGLLTVRVRARHISLRTKLTMSTLLMLAASTDLIDDRRRFVGWLLHLMAFYMRASKEIMKYVCAVDQLGFQADFADMDQQECLAMVPAAGRAGEEDTTVCPVGEDAQQVANYTISR
eukprot:GHVN01086531.1.p2 GENE.GHVN01086531.1~~GHVN01086531.1.p2  ORF type:complete len:139 (-),score=17.12 GHVN01086531.1:673-1089(-)